MKKLKNVVKALKKIKETWIRNSVKIEKGYFHQKRYVSYIDRLPVEEKRILLESQKGHGMEWNVIELAKELCRNPRYGEYEIWLTVSKKTKSYREAFLKEHGLERVRLVEKERRSYVKLLATAKYLVNDSEFPAFFLKREGQVYLNLWNGAAPRKSGKHEKKDFGKIGNRQRNFYMADYLMFSEGNLMERVVEDYMLENLATVPCYLCGHPRNSIFFEDTQREELRKRFHMEDKKVYAYLPAKRKATAKTPLVLHRERIARQLWALDRLLAEDQVIYAKLQDTISSSIDWEGMRHVLPWPKSVATYEVLNASDGLISDYSGVVFDYAVTGRKIVLFQYDKDDFLEENEYDLDFEALPFQRAESADKLFECLMAEEGGSSGGSNRGLLGHTPVGAARALCRLLLTGEETAPLEKKTIRQNGKKNIMIFGGDFTQNGITTSLINLLNSIDRTKENYYVLYKIEAVRGHQERLKSLPEGISYIGFHGVKSISLWDKLKTECFFVPKSTKLKLWHKQAQKDIRRVFSGCRVDKVIQFNGYVDDMILMFEDMPCSRTIYAHNDMNREMKTKKNVTREVLEEAYHKYDSVAVVTPDLIPVTQAIAAAYKKQGSANIVVTRNVINYRKVQELSAKELQFDQRTVSNVTEAGLHQILGSAGKKFITIGRFSHEKGHFRLIDIFEKLHREHPEHYLIILGGYGKLYQETVDKAAAGSAADHIVVIRYLSNPYALLKQCDYFVLSSFYEGFGLVLAEADIVGLPCFSTDVTGPKMFMEQYGGTLVENSEEGIYRGMLACLAGELPPRLNIDYETYNRECRESFEALMP